MVGCAAMLGLVAFVGMLIIFLISAIIHRDPDMLSPTLLLPAGMVGGMTFVAALILMIRDRSRHDMTMSYVRRSLMERRDIDNDEFCSSLPEHDNTLLIEVRDAVASFFEVPPAKIHPHDQLQQNFLINTFESQFVVYVVSFVLNRRGVTLDDFTIQSGGFKDLSELANAIQATLRTADKSGD